MNVMKDDNFQQIRIASGWRHLTAPGIGMKRSINVKTTPAPVFLKGSGSVCGKKTLGFFGFRESNYRFTTILSKLSFSAL